VNNFLFTGDDFFVQNRFPGLLMNTRPTVFPAVETFLDRFLVFS
jgi:hypothetical protein